MLELTNVQSGYGKVSVLQGVDITIEKGQLVAIIGANGAGKSTLLRTIAGLIKPLKGTISFDGHGIGGMPPHKVCSLGVAHVPENRRVFPNYTVEDNLLLGAYTQRHKRRVISERRDAMLERFPRLSDRRRQLAGTMSGGEQQILAIAMGLMADPRLLMLDEPSLGLAPVFVENVFAEIDHLKQEGTTILLVEQLARKALSVADHAVVLQHGEVVAAGTSAELANDDAVRAAYLGA